MSVARPLVVIVVDGERVEAATLIANGNERPLVLDHVPARHDSAGRALSALAEAHPDANIAWCERRQRDALGDPREWPALRRHDREIVHSGTAGRNQATESFGYVAFDSPAIRPPRFAHPEDTGAVDAWIAPDAGCASSRCLLAAGIDPRVGGFGAVLVDLGLRALRRGLVPRVDRALAPVSDARPTSKPATSVELARLIRRHHDRRWLAAWLVAGLIFERRLRIAALAGLVAPPSPAPPPSESVQALGSPSPFLDSADETDPTSLRIDALIPTLGRPECVGDLLTDLAAQTLPIARVAIIEQCPPGLDPAATLDPSGIDSDTWPFEVVHRRVEWTGACRARNLGLAALDGDFVLMLDDDIRIQPRFTETLLDTIRAFRAGAVIGAVRLADQPPAAPSPPIVWPYFASGAALVDRTLIDRAGGFDEAHEGGFGEDFEFGLRLMAHGGVVLRQPAADVLHLKASRGGFRHRVALPWEGSDPAPKPSPTVLYARRAQLTPEQVNGYRLFYTLKRLLAVSPIRWTREFSRIQRGWHASATWASRLVSSIAIHPPDATDHEAPRP